MRYRHREQYQSVIGKRHWLQSNERFSNDDEAGSKVVILVPFMEKFVYDERDSGGNFEKQTAELIDYYTHRDREPYAIMGATADDFNDVMADPSVPTVVVAGFGHLSSVAVPLSKDRLHDQRHGYLDWLHLAGMATHLKLGQFVMYTCCGYGRSFNVPLPVGVVSSHRNILAPLGQGLYAADGIGNQAKMKSISEDELTYDQIKSQFPMQRSHNIAPQIPDMAYIAARGIYKQVLRRDNQPDPLLVSIPYPDLRQYL